MRALAVLASCAVLAASAHAQDPVRIKPLQMATCPETPQSLAYDPSDPKSVRKAWKGAPRIVLALGLTRHEQLKALLARGETPNVCVLGASVLTLSAASGDIEEVEILLDGGADPDRPTDALGGTPLLMALDLGHWDVARLLLARGANPKAMTTGHMTSLIKLSGSWPSAPAQRAEQVALAAYLIDHGVGVDDQLSGPGTSALMMAAIRGNEELVQLLLQRGADPRLEDRRGQTALAFTARKGHAAVAEVLASALASAAPASSEH